MKAVVYTTYGPPDVLQFTDVATPSPGDNEVLIKVRATTVNRTDCGYLRAKPFIIRIFSGLAKPQRPILGSEFAGDVVEIGSGVSAFAVGDRVFGYCEGIFGAYAQYMTMPADGLMATIPEGMSYEEVAPTTEGAHYALGNIRKAGITAGQRVLINGATGAIGSAALQLVKHIGAEVTAVCNTKNVERIWSLGADAVVDYEKEDFTTLDETFDCVFDAVGKSTFGACKRLLKPGGIYMSTELGPYAQNPFLALWTAPFGSKKVLFPLPSESKKDVLFLKSLLESGDFKPVIDRHYPLEQIAEAFRYVETGQKTGNVVITVAHTDT